MKMKRAVIQITMDFPAKQSPFDYIAISGGRLVSNLKQEILKEEDLGDVDMPWAQKSREYYAVRRLIQDGVTAGIDDAGVSVVVYGSHYSDTFSYWLSIDLKKDPGYLSTKLKKLGPIEVLRAYCDKGVLRWSNNREEKTLATMSVGNPNISTEIADLIKKLLKK